MNHAVMFSSRTDLWSTPQDLFDELDAEFHFSVDVCAIPENAKCVRFFSPVDDGLVKSWKTGGGAAWCNPPYGRKIGEWVRKAAQEAADGQTVVMLIPARTDTRWFHEYILGRAEIRFLRGRLRFGGAVNPAPFPSMVVIFAGERKERNHGKV
ncbi:MAG: adenine methyltransferase [Oscillospiraceae bacterium]|nr:adenine methyltransferase [Oscillospiraceae bacterium]